MSKISVIITAYNVDKYITQCLDSVINQNFEDIEIVCVNDGSKDNTLEIINQYAKNDSRIVAISHENIGVSATRNVALKAAAGEYILFLDGDDYLQDGILEKLYVRASRDRLDFLMGCADTFVDGEYSNEEKIEKFMSMYKIKGEYGENIYAGPEIMCMLRKNKDYYASSCVKLINNQFLKNNDLLFEENMIHEDELFSIKTFLLAKRVGIIKETIFMRRMRMESIMTKVTKKENTLGYLTTMIEGATFILKHNEESFYQIEIASILKGIVAAIVRTYQELSDEEREAFEQAMTSKQKFFFDVFVDKQLKQQAQVINLKDNAQKASKVKASLEQMLDTAKKEQIKADAEIEKIQSTNEQLMQEIDSLKEKIKTQKDKNKKLKEDKEKLEEAIALLKCDNDSLKENIVKLEKDKVKLKEKVAKLKQDKINIKEKNRLQIEKIKGSRDYRLGRAVLKGPRKIKNIFKKNG